MLKKTLMAAVAAVAIGGTPVALSHLVQEEPMQSFRQSYFTMLAMNFGPIAGMVKGDIPWNEDMLLARAQDISALTSIDVARAFGPGSDKGTTRAKPAIWENTDDFLSKYQALKDAAPGLLAAAESGEKAAVGAAVKEMGGACKACHDEYKSKDYLY